MKKRLPHIVTLIFLGTFMTACGGGGSDDSSVDTTTTTPEGVIPTVEVNVDLFKANSLATIPMTEDCTLSNGAASTCYRITVTGTPSDHNEGPYCPPNTSSSAEEGGIWFDGSDVYEADGDFFLRLPEIYNDNSWNLHNADGSIRTSSCSDGQTGTCVECYVSEFASGQPTTTVLIPTTPVRRTTVGDLGRDLVGVSLNGVKLEGPAPINQILASYSLGIFDDCAGHVNPFEGYHYHGGNGCSEGAAESDGHAPAFAYALDGYLIYSMLDTSGNEETDLDSCRGHSDEIRGYHYHVASPAENLFIGCFSGETAQ